MAKGKLIVIEGIDGCGKTTLYNGLMEHYGDDAPFKFIENETELMDAKRLKYISKSILNDYNGTSSRSCGIPFDSDLQISLINLAHFFTIRAKIKKWLDEGYHCVADRWYISTLAYNIDPRDQSMIDAFMTLIHELDMDPDLVLYLETNMPLVLGNIRKRATNDSGEVDKNKISIYENKEKLSKVLDHYSFFLVNGRKYGSVARLPIHSNDDYPELLNAAITRINNLIGENND